MNTVTHPVAPEEVMAYLDNEANAAEAQRVAGHLAECAECAQLRDGMQNTARALRAWSVPAAPATLDGRIEQAVAGDVSRQKSKKPRAVGRVGGGRGRPWMIAAGGAVAGMVGLVVVAMAVSSVGRSHNEAIISSPAPEALSAPAPAPPETASGTERRSSALMSLNEDTEESATAGSASKPAAAPENKEAAATTAPMIARTVALTVLVKNITASRARLEAILALREGYAAQLTISTPDDGAPSLQASLRIPVNELAAVLNALRGLGQVQNETQSGEDVTQQHTDLMARLNNARETETILRQLMQKPGAKMDEVLAVEEQLSQTRGEIEQMEADQQVLEHRVSFATVDLQLTEEYKAQLAGSSLSVGTRVRNGFVAGIGNAGSSLLGLVVFAEEVGPVLLVWCVVLGIPVALVWWRYRKVRGRA